jgi:small ligand-binding sensory domain FIST
MASEREARFLAEPTARRNSAAWTFGKHLDMSTPAQPLTFAAALSTQLDTTQAAAEACVAARRDLGGVPDLAVVFFSREHAPHADALAPQLCDLLGTDNVLGCSGDSIVGVGREVEEGPAISLWLAKWPGVTARLLNLHFERTPEGGVIQGWPDEVAGEWPEGSFLVLLGEPYSFPADALLERLNEDRPGVSVVGGMASGGLQPGDNRLILGRHSYAEGAAVALISGPVRLRTIVSQGCRPIGRHFVVTKSERNIIHELGGKPALIQLKEIFDELPNREKLLVQRAPHLGRVVSEYQERFEQGDFLVRNIIGSDPSGAIAVTDYIRVGQTVQFHIRDQETADAELQQLLAAAKKQQPLPLGGLLFTCNGRGTRLFSQPHHDAAAIEKALGKIPLAGFFAQGELGPIGQQNFMHGFTASLALFAAAR